MIQFAIGFAVGVAVAFGVVALIALWYSEEMITVIDEEDE